MIANVKYELTVHMKLGPLPQNYVMLYFDQKGIMIRAEQCLSKFFILRYIWRGEIVLPHTK